MAALGMTPSFSLQVNLEELRLVLKALGGRLKEEELLSAKALCDHLTKQRANELVRTADQLRSALGDDR